MKAYDLLPPALSMKELLTQHRDPPKCIVEEFLPVGGLSLLVAHPKAGKSTLVRNLMLSVARGKKFFGRQTDPGTVCYFALEEHIDHVTQEFRLMGAYDEPIYTRTGSIPKPLMHEVIGADIARFGATLAVIDPLYDALSVSDANSYAVVNQAMKELLYVARGTGCHILTVHHTNKGEGRAGSTILGSQALAGATDCNMFLTMRRDETRLFESNQRVGRRFELVKLRFDEGCRTLDLEETAEEEKLNRIEEELLKVLGDKSLSTTAWRNSTKGKNTDKALAVGRLAEMGVVESYMEGKTTMWRRKRDIPCLC